MLDTPNSPETQASEAKRPQGTAQPKAWGKVPEDLMRDPEVNEAALVLTAYRSTFSKSYVLREGELLNNPPVKKDSGLGKNAIRRAISWMCSKGIIKRAQPKPCMAIVETFTLEVPTVGFLTVWRKWFDASLTLKAMAAWLFLLVGTGKGPVVWAREIRERFGWHPRTVGKVMRELDEAGLLTARNDRNQGGAYRGVGYQSQDWHLRGSEKRGSEKAGNILKTSPTEDLPTKPSGKGSESQQGYYASTCVEAPTSSVAASEAIEERTAGEIHYSAIMDKTMLGWVDQHTLTEAVFDGGPYEEHLEAVCAMASDADLRQRLRQAADGRIGRRLLAPEGLHTARWLAAALVREPGEEQEAVTPAKALNAVLEAVWARIGCRRGEWLNSWELIGHRIAGRHYECGDAAEQVFADVPTTGRLKTVLKADVANTLSKRLRKDAAGLDAFLAEQSNLHDVAPDEVLAIIKQVLTKQLVDGNRIYSWRFFADAVAEEVHKQRLETQGIRPGDVFGAHKRRG